MCASGTLWGVFLLFFFTQGWHPLFAKAVLPGLLKIKKTNPPPVCHLIGAKKKTNPTPALPFITVKYGKEVPYLFDILDAAIKNLSSTSSEILLLKGLKRIELEKYYEVPNPKL